MNKMTRILSLVMALILACAMISTAGAEDYGFIGKKSKPVKLTVHENSKCGLAKGGKIQLKMAGADGSVLQAASFDSSDSSVAMVNSGGTIKAKRTGKTKITMTATTGETYTLTVTVADPDAPDKIGFVEDVYTTYAGMETDLTEMLTAKPYPGAIDLKRLSWSSSNVRIVTVDKNGKLVAQGAGKATVTVKTPNGKTASMLVVVERNILNYLQPTPQMTYIDYGEEIYLKSVEIVHPGVVACEYWLLFKHLPVVRSTYFSWVEDHINIEAKAGPIRIVDGSMPNIKCRTKGQTIKLFKVIYKGDAVKNTNVNLTKYRKKISWDSHFWLNWKY